ncbi:MAG: hypothetical protein FJX80_02125 [Bacteroidetes bacterium]|nr:hypothetical protein [Bacteroidota bacterium]
MFGGTKQSKRRKRNNKQTKSKETQKVKKPVGTATTATTATISAPEIETHRFISSITFDGKTLTTQTQQDDEPVIWHRYTKEQLAREIPIGNELVEKYLDGKMPKELQAHQEHHRRPVFRNVLVSPADLGLLPPRELDRPIAKMSRRRQPRRHHRIHDNDNNEVKMLVNKQKHIFDLP